jgi:hypothetical protein
LDVKLHPHTIKTKLFRNQNGGRLFRRPKFTLSCSAEEKKGRKPRDFDMSE